MVVFASDLDGTLIHTWKREIGRPKVCVEVYEGREISYMTQQSLQLFRQVIGRMLFVPVTTRSIEQYQRIDFGIQVPLYALTCNGGILLQNGVIAEAWRQESLTMAEPALEEIQLGMRLLEQDTDRSYDIRWIEQLFVFTKSRNSVKTVQCLKQNLDLDKVDVFHNGIKVYILPKAINKGNALKRLKEKLLPKLILAAGDSEFDLPMLQAAQIGFGPQELFPKEMDHIITFMEKDFTAAMLEKVLDIMNTNRATS